MSITATKTHGSSKQSNYAIYIAAQCIVIGPVCVFVCLWRAGGRCLLPRYLETACIDLHQSGSVGAGSYGNWKHYTKRHRVCEIPAQFVRHTQTQAVCVWSKRWARISVGWDDYSTHAGDSDVVTTSHHSLMSPIGKAIRWRIVTYRRPSTSAVLCMHFVNNSTS